MLNICVNRDVHICHRHEPVGLTYQGLELPKL